MRQIIEHEQHRLERHAGKVVYEAPAEREPPAPKEPQHPTLKPASAAIQVRGQTPTPGSPEGRETPAPFFSFFFLLLSFRHRKRPRLTSALPDACSAMWESSTTAVSPEENVLIRVRLWTSK